MSKDIAAEIEKRYGDVDFAYPLIYFGYNSIRLRGRLSELESVYYFMFPIVFIWIPIFIVDSIALTILFILLFIYSIFHGMLILDIVNIDFLRKEVFISNKFQIVNYLRKIFRRPTKISFNEIIEFKNYRRPSGRFVSRGNVLVMKTYDHRPIKIAEFQFERESRYLAELLNEYIVGKPGIID